MSFPCPTNQQQQINCQLDCCDINMGSDTISLASSTTSNHSQYSNHRPNTLRLNNCDYNNITTLPINSSSGCEWTAQVEESTSPSDPFSEQDFTEHIPQVYKRTVIRKVGLKRNNVNKSLDSKVCSFTFF